MLYSWWRSAAAEYRSGQPAEKKWKGMVPWESPVTVPNPVLREPSPTAGVLPLTTPNAPMVQAQDRQREAMVGARERMPGEPTWRVARFVVHHLENQTTRI